MILYYIIVYVHVLYHTQFILCYTSYYTVLQYIILILYYLPVRVAGDCASRRHRRAGAAPGAKTKSKMK